MLPTPEFSRLFAVDGVPPGGIVVDLVASLEERRALAVRFDLLALDRLEGELRLERAGDGVVHVAGRVQADVVQRCVATLEPVNGKVDATFERLFSRDVPLETTGEVEIDAEADLPEPIPPNGLDLGEILAEELSLALEPYPRSPDADQRLAERAGDAPAAGPFGALASLRKH